MGVAGSGKTTVGRKLAETLNGTFLDADDFHPPENVAKMRAGIALDDTDRLPWLDSLAEALQSTQKQPVVLACSALKEIYRDRLLLAAPDLVLVFLDGDPALIRQRMGQRADHFMPTALLESQLQTLEAPENALHLDIAEPVEVLVAQILAHV
jgi:carbohydrate kinase (thermoresistant glucokinase family)